MITSFPFLFCFLVLESLGFWEEVRGIILGSELVTGFPCTFKVPGLPQYLQSLTKLALSAMWTALDKTREQPMDVPITFSQLLESSFPEVRLLTLESLLEMFSSVASGPGEKGLPFLLCSMGEKFLLLAMNENHPECFCKVKSDGPYIQEDKMGLDSLYSNA